MGEPGRGAHWESAQNQAPACLGSVRWSRWPRFRLVRLPISLGGLCGAGGVAEQAEAVGDGGGFGSGGDEGYGGSAPGCPPTG